MDTLGTTLVVIVVAIIAIAVIWLILWRLYQRSTTDLAFVRTGFLGQKVVINGGAFVIPVLHDVTRVAMNTVRIEVARNNQASLITRDRLRIDIVAAFFVRVQAAPEAVLRAAQTLGSRTSSAEAMGKLLEDRFVAALRAAAATMTLEELHEQRAAFVGKVREGVAEALAGNGLELESASVTRLDQTNREFFNPTNAFDAAGLTKLTLEIEERRRRRNEIEQDSQVAIQLKNLEAERRLLEIQREEEYARLEQEREIALRRAEQQAEVSSHQAARKRAAEEAAIAATQAVEQARIASDRALEEERLTARQAVREREIATSLSLETAEIERRAQVELAEQSREVAIAEQSRARSAAQAEAEAARVALVKAEEAVLTARDLERVERAQQIELIQVRAATEREGHRRIAAARAEEAAAEHQGGAIRQIADAEAAAERLRAAAAEIRAAIDAEARRAMNEADNALSPEARELRLRLALIDRIEGIVRESVRPLERIEGIKILQVEGLGGGGGGGNGHAGGDSLADQLVNSALRHRGQAPLVDYLLREIGIADASPESMSKALRLLADRTAPLPDRTPES